MLDLKVKGDFLADFAKQADAVGKGARKALTRVAFLIRDAEVAEMKRVFDRPTPYALAGLYVQGASSADRPNATVGLKDAFTSSAGVPAEKFLDTQIQGGQRRLKASEKLLAAAGVLPDGMRAVPSVGARLDAYGNMESGQIQAILSYFRVHTMAGYDMNRSYSRKRRGVYRDHDWIAIPPGEKLAPGIYLSRSNFGSSRRGASLVPVLLFVRSPTYKARFDFHGVARRVIDRSLAAEFEAALRMGSAYSPSSGASAPSA